MSEEKTSDSARIDSLVTAVGEMKGQVASVVTSTKSLQESVEGLRDTVAGMVRLEMSHRQTMEQVADQRVENGKVQARLQTLENDMPALRELRQDVRRGVWVILSAVLLAGLALVVKT
jgi:regulator of replication initiation timing